MTFGVTNKEDTCFIQKISEHNISLRNRELVADKDTEGFLVGGRRTKEDKGGGRRFSQGTQVKVLERFDRCKNRTSTGKQATNGQKRLEMANVPKVLTSQAKARTLKRSTGSVEGTLTSSAFSHCTEGKQRWTNAKGVLARLVFLLRGLPSALLFIGYVKE
jgi:hypothetical protein